MAPLLWLKILRQLRQVSMHLMIRMSSLRFSASILVTTLILFSVFDHSALSQVVKINESALTPYKATELDGRQNAAPSAYIYVAVRPGPTGTLNPSDAGARDLTITT